MNSSERIVLNDNDKEDKIIYIFYGYPKDRLYPANYIDVTKESLKIGKYNTIVIPGGHTYSDKVREKYFGYDKINNFFKIDKEKEVVLIRQSGQRKTYSKWKKLVIKSDYLFNKYFISKSTV